MDQDRLTLYRKYRPQTFAEVLNQEVVKQTVQNAIRLNKVAHAYLFSGPRGTGKTTVARLIAKTVNCQNLKTSESEPCNSCEMCSEMSAGHSLDLIEIDAASNRGIDEIRELREGIKFSPLKAKYKVFIIDEAHMLTKEAFNALLKTLEEPPAHALFILATTEPEKLPATILSRVQRFDFRRITLRDILGKLEAIAKKENLAIESEALRLIAATAEGSIRDAESLLSQVIAFREGETTTLKDVEEILGSINFAKLEELLRYLANGDSISAVRFINEAEMSGYEMHELARALLSNLRKMMILKVDPKLEKLFEAELSDVELESLKKLSQTFDGKKLNLLVRSLLNSQYLVRRAVIQTLPLELAILEVLGAGSNPPAK
jgi:DNA polymerase-3 subunit gamma/tau